MTTRDDITGLLHAWTTGDDDAGQALMQAVYAELRRRAALQLRGERPGQTLQPTALVHEAYLRLVDQTRAAWTSRAQFFAIASRVMRRILVDRARAHRAAKRSGLRRRMTLDEALAPFAERDIDVLDLDRALSRLAEFDARKCQVAELRFFAGLSQREVAAALNVSVPTVEREWSAARAWIFAELTKRPPRREPGPHP